MDVRFFLILFLLVSCVPESQVSRDRLASSSPGSSSSGSSGGSGGDPEKETTWNYLNSSTKSITINVANLNLAYIMGAGVENHLALPDNFNGADYCLISRYKIGATYSELRSRVVPLSYYDFNLKRTIRTLRVDFPDNSLASSLCNAPLFTPDPTKPGSFIPDAPALPVTTYYKPADICPVCTSVLSSEKVRLFKRNSTNSRLEELTRTQLDHALFLSIDPNNGVVSNPVSCNLNDCRSRGFDCCLDNQCIKDGSTRPSAITKYSTQLSLAEQERITNPLAYLNYPHLYYICGTSVPSTTGGSTGGGSSYDAAFEQKKKDHKCIQHIKTFTTSVPFHQDVLNTTIDFNESTNPAIECKTERADASHTMYFQTVMKRLYQTCGCYKTTLSDMIAYCPAYEYKVMSADSLGEPTRLDCYTPPAPSAPIPSQRTVNVSSRSAPHRFFNNTGVEEELKTTSKVQEGDEFRYMDEGKVLPVQNNFSMNAILGQMSVSLNEALPAKTVDVEMDQVYLLSTTSGYYTPCPSCAKDSWLSAFTAFPSASNGAGLQAYGHTTQRDSFSTNSTSGNYEDTIFGRACWLPPTMIPFSHSPKSTVQEQRLNRLSTQAALFANGYQRDWYGFNKGALIGSFDGVTWFAVGKGRIVRSTSKKLFLAINAPFADLAAPTMHVVNVQAYDGMTQATQLDYDPLYHLSHPYQNEAGNCQANHLCSTDSDCVTRLGWEYMCADVRDYKTKWPVFDLNGNELAAQSTTLTLDMILQQKKFGTHTTKRCVYRGSGSMCLVNSSSVSDLNKRKSLTCAPNFYCANVNSSGAFNAKISRYGAPLQDLPLANNHFFGKDAEILGRPANYISAASSTALTSAIRSTLTENLSEYEPLAGANTGLCQPGKALPQISNEATLSNPFNQHMSADSSKRTDFISQIGSCNSTLFTSNRYSSCPVIGADGNYEMFASATLNLTTFTKNARTQNACGLDSLRNNTNLSQTADILSSQSPFKTIEARPLNLQTMIEPTLARDACLRRAGQVCQTDLDCSPNKLHATQTDNYSLDFFGNEAERKYYSEYLVCGQADPKPLPNDTEAFKKYDMAKNRCCREVGSEITTYTPDTPLKVLPRKSENEDSILSNDSYERDSFGLNVNPPGIAPNSPTRYSRLAGVPDLGSTSFPFLSAFQDRQVTPGFPLTDGVLLNSPQGQSLLPSKVINVKTANQWSTLGVANSNTCCGGGWIRKFSDGQNDWKRQNRVALDVNNFKCINSRSAVLTNPASMTSVYGKCSLKGRCSNAFYTNWTSCSNNGFSWTDYNSESSCTGAGYIWTAATEAWVQSLVSRDHGNYCNDATGDKGSCAFYGSTNAAFANSIYDTAPSSDPLGNVTVNSITPNFGITNVDNYFAPQSGDYNKDTYIDYANTDPAARRNITLMIPSFIPPSQFEDKENLRVYLQEANGSTRRQCFYDVNLANTTDPTVQNTCGSSTYCCFNKFVSGTSRRLVIIPNTAHGDWTNKKIGAEFTVDTAGKNLINRTKPGSNVHYLKRLGLLELNGIPQITYPSMYCNDVSNVLVPGIFRADIKTSSQFASSSFAFYGGSSWETNNKGLAHEPVFSAHEFKCCTPLGKSTNSAAKCCSGYALPYSTSPSSSLQCALPKGANLTVYFNRFVSNEGRGTEQPGGGLVNSDFDAQTGEPLLETTTIQKITALGAAYCESKTVRQGAAFGSYEPEPQGPNTNLSSLIYNIVDSSNDRGENSNAGKTVEVGYTKFMEGFRWNHHLYCDE